ncbi:MAG TPA: aminoacyl-tRNA hydrolase [Desulfobulbus sp.]|nr:aminoacyl-tRNA hydrolase [Desulfobulbus sp.]
MPENDFLIVGLGNPGKKYAGTRHNAGFIAIEHFATSSNCPNTQIKFTGEYCRQRLFNRQVSLVRPMTYMNKSGVCVAAFVRFFKIPLENILVVHDDLDLPPGRVKVVAGGGAGGHNGVRSIINDLGTKEFARLKIGIGRPPRDGNGHGIPVDRYVLTEFSHEEKEVLTTLLPKIDEAISLFLQNGVDYCMNQIN